MPTRRRFLALTGATALVPLAARAVPDDPLAMATTYGHDLIELPLEPVRLSEAEWRARLTPEAFRVLREEGTERAYTSPLNDETRAGTYACAGCALPLYRSEVKYDSGTGWPSFTEAIRGAVATKPDRFLLVLRTEVHCARCEGHLGHIFEDGPPPTGNRHCLNGVALEFRPDAA